MKSYLQGLITGAVLVFSFMVLIGSTYYDIDDVMSKLDDIESNVSSIKSIVTANPGCQLQLKKGCKENNIKIPVFHICELMYDQYMKDPKFTASFREN